MLNCTLDFGLGMLINVIHMKKHTPANNHCVLFMGLNLCIFPERSRLSRMVSELQKDLIYNIHKKVLICETVNPFFSGYTFHWL